MTMPTVHAVRVFQIPSESRPDKKYKVQYDGRNWYCECPSWVFNYEHKGEEVPRECKHTRRALSLMNTQGAAAYHEIQPIGPWFEQLQEYVGSLVDLSKKGKISPAKYKGFLVDLDRFKEERDKHAEALGAVDTFISVYSSLMKQLSTAL